MSNFFLNILNFIDKFLVMFFPKFFAWEEGLFLKKKLIKVLKFYFKMLN